MRRPATLGLLGVVIAIAGCGGGGSEITTATTPTATAGCADVATPAARTPGDAKTPTTTLDPAKRWTLTFETSCGTFRVRLDPKTSPHATASLVALARSGYFDKTIFHRVVPGFVIQGGDPTQTGGGGPGYETTDTPAADTSYRAGDVAMAKTATEPRGAAGSQFFVMTAPAPGLGPDYAVVGRVVAGMATVARIGKLGDPADPNGTPTRTVVLDHVGVTEG